MRFDNLWLTNKIEETESARGGFRSKKLQEKITEENLEVYLKDRGLLEDFDLLQEKFKLLGTFSGIEVMDAEHAEEEFERFFPNEKDTTFQFLLSMGMKEIAMQFNMDENKYMIVSKSLGARIPVDLRYDKKLLKRGIKKLIAVIPTVLGPKELWDKYNEIHVLVENNVFDSVNLVNENIGEFIVHHVEGQVIAEFTDIVI
jgi:hypothetical protein